MAAGRRMICILIATIDAICVSIVSDMLRSCSYEVIHMGSPMDTLMAMCERKDTIGVVLTNMHRIQAQVARDILHHIQKKLRLQTCLMSPDDRKIELERQDGAFVAYVVHSLNDGVDHQSFWSKVSGIRNSEVAKFAAISFQIMTSSSSSSLASASASASTSHTDTAVPMDGDEESEKGSDQKKDRVVWTEEMERRFLKARYTLDPKDVVPKKILEFMGDLGHQLKLHHVSSHLQKYRKRVKKDTAQVSEPVRISSAPNLRPYTGLDLTQVLSYRVTEMAMEVHDAVMNISGAHQNQAPVEDASAPDENAPPPAEHAPSQNTSQQPAPDQPPQMEPDEEIEFLSETFWNKPPSLD